MSCLDPLATKRRFYCPAGTLSIPAQATSRILLLCKCSNTPKLQLFHSLHFLQSIHQETFAELPKSARFRHMNPPHEPARTRPSFSTGIFRTIRTHPLQGFYEMNFSAQNRCTNWHRPAAQSRAKPHKVACWQIPTLSAQTRHSNPHNIFTRCFLRESAAPTHTAPSKSFRG